MARPYTVTAPRDGVLRYRIRVREVVNPDSLIVQSRNRRRNPFPLPGKVQPKAAAEGRRVQANDPIAELEPSAGHAWEALRALYLVGNAEDLADVERLTHPPAGWDPKIGEQAKLTAHLIRSRRCVGSAAR